MPNYESRITVTATVDGVRFTRDTLQTADNKGGSRPSVAAAKIGQLTTRTDNDTGVLTMAGGHGFVTGNLLDVYWIITGVHFSRTGMTATVAVNAVTVDGGSGDNLPTNLTAVTAMVPVAENLSVLGDGIQEIVLSSPVYGNVTFAESDGTTLLGTIELTPDDAGAPNYTYHWWPGKGETNPLAGDTVGKILFSHGDSSGANEMTGVVFHN